MALVEVADKANSGELVFRGRFLQLDIVIFQQGCFERTIDVLESIPFNYNCDFVKKR